MPEGVDRRDAAGHREEDAELLSEVRSENSELTQQLDAAKRELAEAQQDVRKLARWLEAIIRRAEASGGVKPAPRHRMRRMLTKLHRPARATNRVARRAGIVGIEARTRRLAEVTAPRPEADLGKVVARVAGDYRARFMHRGRTDGGRIGEPFSRGLSRADTAATTAAAYRDYRLGVEWLVAGPEPDPGQSLDLAVLILPGPPSSASRAAETIASAHDAKARVVGTLSEAAASDWVMILSPGDTIDEGLPGRLAKTPVSAVAVITDDEIIDENGELIEGRLKPGFQPDLLLEWDYVGTAVAFRPAAVAGLEFDPTLGADCVRDLLLQCSDKGGQIHKLDAVVVRSRRLPPRRGGDAVRFAERVLARREPLLRAHGLNTVVTPRGSGAWVRYRSDAQPLVSIIIPFRDGVGLLRDCLESILTLSTYPRFEVLLVDNQSCRQETAEFLASIADPRVSVLRYDHPFNYSKVNNFAAAHARGDVLVFLNNDTEVLTHDWLEDMVGTAMRPEVGAAGAFLYFPDGAIQHAGVVMGTAGHCDHLFAHAHEPFLPHEYVRHTRDCLAVTAACVAVRRQVFEDVGGFDERYKVINNDVDLGLKILASGRRNVLLPYVRLIHKESATRDHRDVDPEDIRLLVARAKEVVGDRDPFYHPGANYPRANLVPARRVERPVDVDRMIAGYEAGHNRPLYLPRLPGAGAVGSADATDAEIAASRAVTDAQFDAGHRELGSCTWFIRFDTSWSSAETWMALRLADHLAREHGSRHSFVMCGRTPGRRNLSGIRELLVRQYPALGRARFTALPEARLVDQLPATDIAFCADWVSAFFLLRYNDVARKFYLVDGPSDHFQDFAGASECHAASLRLGIPVIALSSGAEGRLGPDQRPALSVGPCIDPALFHPTSVPGEGEERRPVEILFAVAPKDPGFALGMSALAQVQRRLGDRVRVTCVGANFEPARFGLGFARHPGPIRSEARLAEVYRAADIALVLDAGSSLSYDIARAMSCGAAVVMTTDGVSVAPGLVDGENCVISDPMLTPLVSSIGDLVTDAGARRRLGEAAAKAIAGTLIDPKVQLEQVAGWLAGERA